MAKNGVTSRDWWTEEKYGVRMLLKCSKSKWSISRKLGVCPISGACRWCFQIAILFAMCLLLPKADRASSESFLWLRICPPMTPLLSCAFTIPFYGSHVSLFTLWMSRSQSVYGTHFNKPVDYRLCPNEEIWGYIMPVMFMFILNSYPAGLSLLLCVKTRVTFGQQAFESNSIVDDSKSRAKVEESKWKSKQKKSKFQTKLEDLLWKLAVSKQEKINWKKSLLKRLFFLSFYLNLSVPKLVNLQFFRKWITETVSQERPLDNWPKNVN